MHVHDYYFNNFILSQPWACEVQNCQNLLMVEVRNEKSILMTCPLSAECMELQRRAVKFNTIKGPVRHPHRTRPNSGLDQINLVLKKQLVGCVEA